MPAGPYGLMDKGLPSGGRDCGFESRLGLFFARYYTLREFGRVVKALALGASLERGMGSNPIACT